MMQMRQFPLGSLMIIDQILGKRRQGQIVALILPTCILIVSTTTIVVEPPIVKVGLVSKIETTSISSFPQIIIHILYF
jgi:hypothetical protein